ncbi:MAG: BCAM0308 family protein [Nitrospirota bacterium]
MSRKIIRQRAPRVRRRGEPPADPYLEQLPPKQTARCTQCGALYRNKRWQQAPPAPRRPARTQPAALPVLCPACRKVNDRYANGVVTIRWPKADGARHTILNLIKNQEDWGRQINPLERVISIQATDDALTVLTTNERLAQRIGRALERAFHGKALYRWSRENKLLRVEWASEAAPE